VTGITAGRNPRLLTSRHLRFRWTFVRRCCRRSLRCVSGRPFGRVFRSWQNQDVALREPLVWTGGRSDKVRTRPRQV